MILISHRGNLTGKDEGLENNPFYVKAALESGFDCEIDVWHIDNKFYLGHDKPNYLVTDTFLTQRGLWCHAKNVEALFELLRRKTHCFFIDVDDVTLTSRGYVWLSSVARKIKKDCICVMPEEQMWESPKKEIIELSIGLCSDYIKDYR